MRKFFRCLRDLEGQELEGDNFITLETDDFVKVMNVCDHIGIKENFFNEFDYDNIEIWEYDDEIRYYMIDEEDFNYYDFISYAGDMNEDVVKILKKEIEIDDYLEENNLTKQQLIDLIKKEFKENDIKENGFETHLSYDEYIVDTNYYKLIIDDYFGEYTTQLEEIDEELQNALQDMEELGYIHYNSLSLEGTLYKTKSGDYYIYNSEYCEEHSLSFVYGLYYKIDKEEAEEFLDKAK
ncbi:hypothetical protein [Clostridium tetani]|uniref:hypothetical protein n=1 Tax=Clostridium tetani TaxID=1513 RepID=UPI00100B3B73|nr:hypothetical protein [Clostridium tetani]RXM70333.1 hypothetical protein DP139_06495 [Clostridium tetani]